MRTSRAFLIPLTLVALVVLGADAFAYELQSAGQVVVYAKGLITTGSTSWLDIPGMKGAVTLPAGGDLAATLTLEGDVTGGSQPTMYARAIVDNQVVSPTVIKFFVGGTGLRTHTCTFVAKGLAAGAHKVRFQWSAGTGTTVQVQDRSMVLWFARPDSPDLRLAAAEGSSLSRQSGGWTDIPGLSASVDCPWDARLVVNVSGEFLSLASGRVFLRAVIDGKTLADPSDILLATGASEGTRSFTFVTAKQPRGTRSVSIQWLAEGAAMVLFPTVTVTALPDAVNRHTGLLHQAAPSGPAQVNTSASFVPVPDLGGLVFVPARCDLTVRVSAESGTTTGQLLIRARVDGKPTNTDAYAFCSNTATDFESREAVFAVRNVDRGWHNVQVEWAVGSGGTVYLGDRTLTVNAIPGQWPLLVTAMESTRPVGYQYGGQFASSVVDTQGSKRVFKPYVADNFFRANPGVADWFLENSGNHMYVVEAAVIGPNLKCYNEKYYREQVPDPFTAMKVEALQAADAEFDFNYYDRDRDGKVTPDELYCLIVFYQDSTFGEVRSIPAVPTQDTVTIDYTAGVATAYTPDFKSNGEIGLIDHELCHLLLKCGDMYENGDPTAPGPFSIMDQHGWNAHLDPLHKLKMGKWYEPVGVTGDGYFTIRPIAAGGNVYKLYDPNSHNGEYFLVENRQPVGYDASLPSRGLAVWHCDESRLYNWRTAVEIEPACGPNYQYPNYLFRGEQPGFGDLEDLFDGSTNTDTRWHDSSLSRIGVWGIERVDDQGNVRAFLDVPGPGVLCQTEGRGIPIDPFGEQVIHIRILNTHTASDRFKVTASVPGWASWTTQYVQLGGYQQKILEVRVRPNPTNFLAVLSVTAESTTNSAVSCADEIQIYYTLRTLGSGAPGATVTLDCRNPEEAGKYYEMRASFGSAPGFPVPGLGTVPLQADDLFFATPYLPQIFRQFRNRLDGAGEGRSYVTIPNDNRLKGITVYCAYVTYDTTLRTVSNAVAIPVN